MNAEELRERVIAQLPDAPIVVALGGGADSAVAAWACARSPPGARRVRRPQPSKNRRRC